MNTTETLRAPPPTRQLAQAAALVAALQRRLGARLVETHISWVLLTATQAWKIKKPLRLPFLDFGTLAERWRLCEEELRLNRRLAPALYEAVVPITGTPALPQIGGTGPALEAALQMRRFADGALFSEQLAEGRLAPATVDHLALRLAAFHQQAPVAAADSPHGTAARVGADLQAVIQRLAEREPRCVPAHWRPWVARTVSTLAPEWARRHAEGHVREGHGDLHLANLVCLGDEATAFDALEFDPALRWIDVMADIAFPVMDLHAHGRPDLGFRLLDGWLAGTGDHDGLAVLRAYLAYRALVRAMVARLEPAGAPPGVDYLAAAMHWCRPGEPRLLITEGLPASGKSHLALALLERCGAVRLRSDVERKRLHGLPPLARSASPPGAGLYTEAATRRTYARLLALAEGALRAGWPVIVDAAFLRLAQRDSFRRLAHALGLPFTILRCEASEAVLQARLLARRRDAGEPSEADAAVLAQAQAGRQPLAAHELPHALAAGPAPDPATLAAAWLARGA